MLGKVFSALLLVLVLFGNSVNAAPAPNALADPDFAQFGNMLPLREMRSSFGGMAPMVGRNAARTANFYVIDGRPYRISK